MSDKIKKIFLNNFHYENSAKLVPFAGYLMPMNYKDGIIKEHLHVRNSVGLFDVSHMGQILIPNTKFNKDALMKYIPLNINQLLLNKSYYSFLLNDDAGIIDDLIISKILYKNNEFFYIVYNASRKQIDENIFINNLSNYIFLENSSLLAIQGPNSQESLNFLDNFKDFYFMNSRIYNYLEHDIIVNRSGYTGEDGFEISIPNQVVEHFISNLFKNPNIKLCGLGARDSLRLEAGLSLYGNDLNEKITPIEANLSWSIDKNRLKDKKLNGNLNLLNQIKYGVKKIRVGLKPKSKLILRSNLKIFDEFKKEIGFISSGGFSPILNCSIAMGYLDFSKTQEKIYCLIREKYEELNIEKLPFISNNYKKRSLV